MPVKDIEEFSGISLGPGTLYGTVSTLVDAGLVEPLAPDERRRPYRITAAGTRVLRERLEESAQISKVGLRRLASG